MKNRIISLLLVLAVLAAVFVGCSPAEAKEDVYVLFTNDIHCAMEGKTGFAGLMAYKNSLLQKTDNVLTVDCGDAIQGDFVGTVSKGEYIAEMMNVVGYDLAVPGNHEFDYGLDQLKKITDGFGGQYLGCNFKYTGKGEGVDLDMEPWVIREIGGMKLGFVGIVTPSTLISSDPKNFMEDGEYVYDLAGGNEGRDLWDTVQKSVNECRAAGAEHIIAIAHLGIEPESTPYTSYELIANTEGIDVLLDGHSHSYIPSRIEKNKNGEDTLLASTGEKLTNFGVLTVTASGNFSATCIIDYTEKDPIAEAAIESIKERYEDTVFEVIGHSDTELKCNTEGGIRLVRNRETTIGNFCADAYRTVMGADIALINGGGIRGDIPKGDVTYADIITVNPYGNMLCVVETTGQEILDCLEMACRKTLAEYSSGGTAVGESGEFQQVSGIRFTIDTSIPNPVVLDGETFVSVEGERRVKDVEVLNDDGSYEPIDPERIYTLASHTFLIKSGGSGMIMFRDNVIIADETVLDADALVIYLTEYLDGDLSRYASTEGRITVK